MGRRKRGKYIRMINLAGFAAILGETLLKMQDVRDLPGFPRAELDEDGEEIWEADAPLAWLESQTHLTRVQLWQLDDYLKQARMATEQLLR